jgi:hypothetical protein
MGAKGKTGLEKVVFGSTTLTAIRHLAWPVICVPPGKEFGAGIKKIGFACDFKQVARSTPVQFIRQIVKELKAELHVLNVDYKTNSSARYTGQSFCCITWEDLATISFHYRLDVVALTAC